MPASAMVAEVYPPRREGDDTLVSVELLNGMCITVKLCRTGGVRRVEAPTYTVQKMSYQNRSSYCKPVPVPYLKFRSPADKAAFTTAVLDGLDRLERPSAAGSLESMFQEDDEAQEDAQ